MLARTSGSLLIMLISALLLLFVVACGDGGDDAASTEPPAIETPSSQQNDADASAETPPVQQIAIEINNVQNALGIARFSEPSSCASAAICRLEPGQMATVAAAPRDSGEGNTRYDFIGWMCQGWCPIDTTATEFSIAVTADTPQPTVLTPMFAAVELANLTVKNQSGGSVRFVEGCVSQQDCFAPIADMRAVKLQAVSDSGYRFAEWVCTGCPVEIIPALSSEEIELVLSSNLEIEPTFERVTTLTLTDAAGGSIASDCGDDCANAAGWRARVTATPERDYRFVRWECDGGACPSSGLDNASLSVLLNTDIALAPVFEIPPIAALTLGDAENGRATADCGSNCSRRAAWDATITADPDRGYRFVRWACDGECGASNGITIAQLEMSELDITLVGDITLTPEFEVIPLDRIAFASDRDGDFEIYTMAPDGSDVRQVTDNDVRDWQPTWSPDGKKLAFASFRDGDYEIFTINVDGTDERQITDNDVRDWYPAWSPSGTHIAYISGTKVTIKNADGSGLAENLRTASRVNWLPGGNRLLYYNRQNYGGFTNDEDIFTVSTDGLDSNPVAFCNVLHGNLSRVSPDGTFAYACLGNIRVGSTVERGISRLSDLQGTESSPTYSPDFAQIAFSSDGDGDGEIYKFDSDGKVVQLTDNFFDDVTPAWSTR